MLKRIKPKSEFSRNVLTLMTGTTVAQAIPIAISPILTRLYTPEDFGVLALFVAISSIFGSMANGRYELAIMLPKKDEDAINIFALGFIIVSLLSLFLLFLVVVFHDIIVSALGNEAISLWLYFIPIAVFFIGLFNILNYFNNRKKYYKDLANATIIKSIITAIVQLSVGFINAGVAGLISGQLASQFFANMKLLKNILNDKLLTSKISKVKIIALARRYRDFPKFSLVANLLNAASSHLTNIIVSSIFSVKTLGFYALTQRLMAMPSALIGGSIAQVFFQEATQEKQKYGNAQKTFKSTLIKLILIALPPFVILYFVVEDIFAFVFGEAWVVAGLYAKILLPFFFINFISSPLAMSMSVFEKQKNALVINIILIASALGSLYLSSLWQFSFEQFLSSFSTLMSIDYFLFIFYYYAITSKI